LRQKSHEWEGNCLGPRFACPLTLHLLSTVHSSLISSKHSMIRSNQSEKACFVFTIRNKVICNLPLRVFSRGWHRLRFFFPALIAGSTFSTLGNGYLSFCSEFCDWPETLLEKLVLTSFQSVLVVHLVEQVYHWHRVMDSNPRKPRILLTFLCDCLVMSWWS